MVTLYRRFRELKMHSVLCLCFQNVQHDFVNDTCGLPVQKPRARILNVFFHPMWFSSTFYQRLVSRLEPCKSGQISNIFGLVNFEHIKSIKLGNQALNALIIQIAHTVFDALFAHEQVASLCIKLHPTVQKMRFS